MTSTFDLIQGATIFNKLDLINAYHLVRIKEGDEWKLPSIPLQDTKNPYDLWAHQRPCNIPSIS